MLKKRDYHETRQLIAYLLAKSAAKVHKTPKATQALHRLKYFLGYLALLKPVLLTNDELLRTVSFEALQLDEVFKPCQAASLAVVYHLYDEHGQVVKALQYFNIKDKLCSQQSDGRASLNAGVLPRLAQESKQVASWPIDIISLQQHHEPGLKDMVLPHQAILLNHKEYAEKAMQPLADYLMAALFQYGNLLYDDGLIEHILTDTAYHFRPQFVLIAQIGINVTNSELTLSDREVCRLKYNNLLDVSGG